MHSLWQDFTIRRVHPGTVSDATRFGIHLGENLGITIATVAA